MRQLPHAGVVRRVLLHVFDKRDLAVERGIDLLRKDRLGFHAVVAGNVLGFRARCDRGDEHSLRERHAAQRLEPAQCLGEREVRRDHADARVVTGDRDLLVERDRESFQAREIGVGVGLDLDAVLAVEEVRDLLVRAGELADDVGIAGAAIAVVVAPVGDILRGETVENHVVVDRVHAGERAAVEGLELCQLLGVDALVFRDGGKRLVVELALLAGARSLIQTELGGLYRRAIEIRRHEAVEQLVEGGRRRRRQRERLGGEGKRGSGRTR